MTVSKEIPCLGASAVALGFFDGIHKGHIAVIDAASGEETRVVLSIGANEGGRRIISDAARAELLSSMGVDWLVSPPFEQVRNLTGEQFVDEILVEKLHAKKVSCGFNYHFGAGGVCCADDLRRMCEQRGIECVVVGQVTAQGETVSSSAIRSLLAQGDIPKIAEMLDRPYGYRAEVVSGKHLGRTLGAPTLNQLLPEDMLLPRMGVYASETIIDGARMYSVTNIGVCPTVGGERPLSETWIPGFSGDLYGRVIEVQLVGFIRPEQKFDTIEQLRERIHLDGELARQMTLHRMK